MMPSEKYLELSACCRKLADSAGDRYSRYQLQQLADAYMALAKSVAALNQSAKALQALDERRKK
jgi:hypothetical protein